MLLLSLSTLLLFDSCRRVEAFHSSSLWTLAALPVAIPGLPERRGGFEPGTPLPILPREGRGFRYIYQWSPVPTVKKNLLSQG